MQTSAGRGASVRVLNDWQNRLVYSSLAASSVVKKCTYCGKEYPDEATVCAVDQQALKSDARAPATPNAEPRVTDANSGSRRHGSFFKWIPTAIVLWVLGVLFASLAVISAWLVEQETRGAFWDVGFGDSRRTVRILVRGCAENAVIAVLCITAWYLMRRRERSAFLTGSLAVAAGLSITVSRWIYWEIHGRNPIAWAEPLFLWPFLIYAIVFGYLGSRA